MCILRTCSGETRPGKSAVSLVGELAIALWKNHVNAAQLYLPSATLQYLFCKMSACESGKIVTISAIVRRQTTGFSAVQGRITPVERPGNNSGIFNSAKSPKIHTQSATRFTNNTTVVLPGNKFLKLMLALPSLTASTVSAINILTQSFSVPTSSGCA